VPRAKRTDRAEARRRYRASIGEQPEDETAEPAAPESPGRAVPSRPASTGERPSLGNAFRASFRPLNLGEDLRYLPKLIVDRSVWLPILLTIAAGVAFAVTSGSSWLVNLVATYFVAPPALGSVFIGGFLAPRASYLVGLIVGFVSAVVATVIILTSSTSLMTGQPLGTAPTPTPAAIAASPSASAGPATSGSPGASAAPGASASAAPGASASAAPGASPTPSSTPTPTPSSIQDQIIYAFVTSPPFGMFFAAAAAWYRRFLRLSRPTPPRSQQGRRGDGRTRTRR
jgi:hypothetical protein